MSSTLASKLFEVFSFNSNSRIRLVIIMVFRVIGFPGRCIRNIQGSHWRNNVRTCRHIWLRFTRFQWIKFSILQIAANIWIFVFPAKEDWEASTEKLVQIALTFLDFSQQLLNFRLTFLSRSIIRTKIQIVFTLAGVKHYQFTAFLNPYDFTTYLLLIFVILLFEISSLMNLIFSLFQTWILQTTAGRKIQFVLEKNAKIKCRLKGEKKKAKTN